MMSDINLVPKVGDKVKYPYWNFSSTVLDVWSDDNETVWLLVKDREGLGELLLDEVEVQHD